MGKSKFGPKLLPEISKLLQNFSLSESSRMTPVWFRIVICPFVIFFPDIFATITLIHKQIIAVAGYYACGAFITQHAKC